MYIRGLIPRNFAESAEAVPIDQMRWQLRCHLFCCKFTLTTSTWGELFFSDKYSKTCLKRHLKRNTKLVFNTDYRLMQVESIAECSKEGILQYFRPSLSYHFPFRTLFCLFLSSRIRQVLLYVTFQPVLVVDILRINAIRHSAVHYNNFQL